MVISRRSFLAVPVPMFLSIACGSRPTAGYRGYAFVANEDGQAVAAVDLEAMAVARHIALDASPSQVVAAQTRPSVYALTPGTGSIHEIQSDRLSFKRKVAAASSAVSMGLDARERALYVLAREPRALVRVSLDLFRVEARMALPGSAQPGSAQPGSKGSDPVDFAIAPDGKTAAVSDGAAVRFIDLSTGRVGDPLGEGDFGAVRFRFDGRALIVADRGERRLSLYDVASSRLIAHLPIAVRPDNVCFNGDGGQLFITGEGMDGVVIVYPYHTPEVAETVLAGHTPGTMAASAAFLFIASPLSGTVSILQIGTHRVIGVVSVGSDPGFVAVTRDDEYALVLNRKSGDVAVLRVGAIGAGNDILPRDSLKKAALLTVIPVGSRPVSADVRGV
jgi:DNA-binding beta-propeller fold protein YncE